MITGSEGVSFLLPQLFLSQHRLRRNCKGEGFSAGRGRGGRTERPPGSPGGPAASIPSPGSPQRGRAPPPALPGPPRVAGPARELRHLPGSDSINCDAKIWKTCCGVCLCSELRRREGRRLGNNFSQLQLLFTSNCQAVISGKDARCHLQPIFLLGIY